MYSILDDSAASYPYKAAIDYEGSRIRYKELKLMADSLANALLGMGVGKGKSVVVYLPNCPQYIIGDFAILKAGAFTTPISPLHKAGEVEYQLNKCGAETIICLEEDLELFESMKDKTNLQNIIVTDIGDYADKGAAAQTKTAPGTHRFVDLITEHEGDPPPPDPGIDPTEDLAYLAFTGGSTGIPKGVMLTHSARYCNVMQGLPWVYSPLMGGIKGKSSVIIPVPLFHIYGHWVLHSAMYMGLRIILLPDPRNMDKLVELMQRNRPLLVCVVPTQLMRLVGKKIGRMPVTIMSGAAPLPSQVADDIGEELKMPISEGYGLTETGPVTHMNVSSFSKVTGFMRMFKRGIGIPIPDTEVKLVDPGTGEDIGFDEEGELYLRGPQLMKGYWPTPGDGLTDDGWVTTGDVAKVDEDGYFYIVDRVKDMANISGYKVYTTVVDEVLFTHPAVSMAVSIGVPDPERAGSERIKAFIRVKDDYEGEIKTEDLIEHCREKLPPYAIPKFIEFNDDLPLTVTEKLFKRALREKEVQKMKEKGELG
ncbi:MAG: AMP-binding protein [Actinomycetota bacterium]|nr:AMP-binding protein [Actinomycetota bacterium]